MLPVFAVATVAVAIYAFVSLLLRVRRNALAKAQAFRRYAAWVITPVIVYALLFGALLALDRLTGIGLLSELLARSFVVAAAFGILVWLVSAMIFGATLLVLKSRGPASAPQTR